MHAAGVYRCTSYAQLDDDSYTSPTYVDDSTSYVAASSVMLGDDGDDASVDDECDDVDVECVGSMQCMCVVVTRDVGADVCGACSHVLPSV